jgi:hypothetical protein
MSLIIDCSTCVRAGTSRCSDCVVTFIADRQPDEAIVVDAVEFAALRRLAAAGLVPALEHDTAPVAAGPGEEAESRWAQVS